MARPAASIPIAAAPNAAPLFAAFMILGISIPKIFCALLLTASIEAVTSFPSAFSAFLATLSSACSAPLDEPTMRTLICESAIFLYLTSRLSKFFHE